MQQLNQAIEMVIELIGSLSVLPDQLSIEFQWRQTSDPLFWFETQSTFPKFYWNSRDGREEVFALGQIMQFSDPSIANNVLGEKQRIWGGVKFKAGESQASMQEQMYFFLPQIELERTGDKWLLIVNTSENSQATKQALKQLTFDVPRSHLINSQIRHISYEPDYSNWCHLVTSALDEITQSRMQRVTLARKTRLQLNAPLLSVHVLLANMKKYESCFHFMMAMDKDECFLGSTPERLFKRQGQALMTEALAGTTRRSDDVEQDTQLAHGLLSKSSENQHAVSDIYARLSQVSTHVRVNKVPEIVKLSKTQYVKCHITACLGQSICDADLLALLQPTCESSGYPKVHALTFIKENEAIIRNWHNGSVGYITRNRSEFCVAAHSAFVMKDSIDLLSATGIHFDSEPDIKWKELDRDNERLQVLFSNQN